MEKTDQDKPRDDGIGAGDKIKPGSSAATMSRILDMYHAYGDPNTLLGRCVEVCGDGNSVIQGCDTGLKARVVKYNRNCVTILDRFHATESCMRNAGKSEGVYHSFLQDVRQIGVMFDEEEWFRLALVDLGANMVINKTIIQRTIEPLRRALESVTSMYPAIVQVLREQRIILLKKVANAEELARKKAKKAADQAEEEKEQAKKRRRVDRGVGQSSQVAQSSQARVAPSPKAAAKAAPKAVPKAAPKAIAPSLHGAFSSRYVLPHPVQHGKAKSNS